MHEAVDLRVGVSCNLVASDGMRLAVPGGMSLKPVTQTAINRQGTASCGGRSAIADTMSLLGEPKCFD